MKKIADMNGSEKAAALLVAMGKDAASDILKYLDDDTLVKISAEMAKIESLDIAEKENLIGDFFIDLKKMKRNTSGGEDIARSFLVDAFGSEKSDKILEKVKLMHVGSSFDYLKEADPDDLAALLEWEHPQISTVIIANAPKGVAGSVMKRLSQSLAKDIAIRLAKMQGVSPEVVVRAAESFKNKYLERIKKGKSDSPGGIEKIAGLFNHLDNEIEQRLMKNFEDEMPQFASELRKKIAVFEFETIAMLTNREIRIVMGAITENRIIAKALKGSDEEVRYRILRNVSAHRADEIISLIEMMGPVRKSEVNEARSHIVSIMRDLDAKGKILIKKDGDEIID